MKLQNDSDAQGGCISVSDAQSSCISRLVSYISSFIGNQSDTKTRVMSVSIPTGWGKTRIAIQSILRSTTGKATLILWPQRTGHVTEIWQRPLDWKEKQNSKSCFVPSWIPIDERIQKNKVSYFKYDGAEWVKDDSVKKTKFIESKEDNLFFYVINRGKQSEKEKLLQNEIKKSHIQKKQSPIFFIIDEWHVRDFLNDFENYCEENKEILPEYDVDKAEQFWREKLLGCNTKRKLFVLLLSATPLASTKKMDWLYENASDDEIDKQNKSAEKCFEVLTNVGNQNRDTDNPYAIYEIYPNVLKHKMAFLKSARTRAEKKIEFLRTEKQLSAWCKDYLNILESKKQKKKTKNKKTIKNHGVEIYQREQGIIIETYAKKFIALCDLLQNFEERKFLIFCTYKAEVAQKLKNALIKNNFCSKDTIAYLNEGSRKKILNDFNNPEGSIKYLIATDKDSQGIDLQNSGAWLIHYELPWNPIRVIQRFGRVWRFNKNSDGRESQELTCPVAFYIPSTYSSEEEKINRLERRWLVLSEILTDVSSKHLMPVDFNIAMGIRVTPSPYKE